MAKRMTTADLPKSLGAFKPVGHVMVALPNAETAEQATQALKDAGFTADDIIAFSAGEGEDHMNAMLDDANPIAGFGYEVTLMRRYATLAREGHRWLLVYAPSDEDGQRVQTVARALQAPMAVKYHLLAVEDLV